ncbi:MAG TPA: tRNA-dihydrouridine synthase, partial [Bacteroidales bacterium]|nr:tRNA-dihydrouridine synthase [Bacteroidales bacterium]
IGGIPPQIPTLAERIELCLEHLRNMAQNKNEKIALLEMRRHYAGYFKAIPFFKPIKLQLMAAEDIATCEAILKNWESQTKKEQI